MTNKILDFVKIFLIQVISTIAITIIILSFIIPLSGRFISSDTGYMISQVLITLLFAGLISTQMHKKGLFFSKQILSSIFIILIGFLLIYKSDGLGGLIFLAPIIIGIIWLIVSIIGFFVTRKSNNNVKSTKK